MNGREHPSQTAVVIVERYWPGVTVEGFLRSPLPRAISGMLSLGSIVVPGDEVVLSLLSGIDAEMVSEANRRERLPFVRVVPATLLRSKPRRAGSTGNDEGM